MKNRSIGLTNPKYIKKCANCGREYSSNYERSNPCTKCKCEDINIVGGTAFKPQYTPPVKSKQRPTVKRTVSEEWKGDVYTAGEINGVRIFDHERGLKELIYERATLAARIKTARYQLNWHQKRMEKGAFE